MKVFTLHRDKITDAIGLAISSVSVSGSVKAPLLMKPWAAPIATIFKHNVLL